MSRRKSSHRKFAECTIFSRPRVVSRKSMLGYMISGSVAFGCPGQFAGMLCPAPLIPGSKSGVVTYFAIALPLVIGGKLVRSTKLPGAFRARGNRGDPWQGPRPLMVQGMNHGLLAQSGSLRLKRCLSSPAGFEGRYLFRVQRFWYCVLPNRISRSLSPVMGRRRSASTFTPRCTAGRAPTRSNHFFSCG